MADNVLNDLELEQLISGMSDRKLAEYNTRQIHSIDRRLRKLEGRSKRTMSLLGGTGAIIGAAVIGGLDYLLRRGGS